MRTIDRISTTQNANGTVVVALCTDGTLWRLPSNSETWVELPPIPHYGQDDE